MPTDFSIRFPAAREEVEVSARLYAPDGPSLAWLILAPGAGAGHSHPFMVAFGRGLAARGLHLVTFNFPYIERGRRVPDANDTLEACWQAVLRTVREQAGAAPLLAGGKSMGGRIASQVAAGDDLPAPVRGLVFLGYPLHPPGRPDQQRTAHWPDLRIPALFVQGARDPFAAPDELQASLARFAGPATTHIVEDGDHSFKVPKRAGRTQESVYAEVQDRIAVWARDHVIASR